MKQLKNYKTTPFKAKDSVYDKVKADYAVGFINCLSHTKGTWAGKKFELIPWQEQIIRDLFGVVKPNGYRQFNTAYIEIPKKMGKQLSLDTLIPTPHGFTTMGEIQIGDSVFDENGNICHVVAKSEVDDTEQAYELKFKSCEPIVAGERHLWDICINTKHGVYQSKEIFDSFTNGLSCIIDIAGHFELENITMVNHPVKMQCIQVDSTSHCYLAGRSRIPTHNSELAAAVALLLTCGDEEERAEVYGCAADRQQASIVFEVAADMVRMCPALNKRVKILAATKRIIYLPTNSFYQVLSAEAYSKHGFNIHGVVFDELHTQPNRKLFDVMTKGSGDARMQPLYFLITTAGTDTHSICYETHQKAKDILEGRKADKTFYPVIYGADEADDWTDPKVWKKANPSLGITVGIDKVQAACDSARQNPAEENSFRQLRLNQWVKQAIRWMPMEKWDLCARPVDEEALEGRVCYGGLDLSSSMDITAFVLVFPPQDEGEPYHVLPFFWIPEDNMDIRVNRDHVPYDLWHRQGKLETTEGNVVHYGYIEKFIERLGEKYNIREIAFDRWGAVQMVQNLEGMGFTVVPFGQGFKDMSPPTKELMKLVLERKIAHGGHPVLRWMMDNIFIRTDPAGNIKPDKVIICFSGTGNSYYVSKILCARLGYDQVILGPDVLDRPEILGNPSEIGVVFPTYSGHPTQNLGPLMINVLSKPEFDRLEFFFAITTCGLFPGHSLKIAEQLAMESNILCSFLDWVKMPDTYVPMAPIPSDEVQKEILSKADQKINEIATRILKNDFAIPRRKMLTKLAFKRYCKVCSRPGVPSVHASDACTGCEHCEAVCPRDAITMESGKPLFNSNCENCLACYHFCPVHAIVLDREPSGGYTYYSNRFTGYCPDYRQDSGDKQEHS